MTLTMVNQPKQNSVVAAVSAYGKRLSAFIRSRVRSVEDAEDILQDVWYQLSNVVDLGQIEQLSAWLYRVARNKITDRYRRTTPETSLDALGYQDDEGTWHIADILLADANTPETAYMRDLFWEELLAALDELPDAQRQVFILNELEDKTLQEIADATGENLKTIISRKGYAVKYLRRRLNDLYEEFLTH